MVEAKYFKDYHHNYLIIKCREENIKEQYQYRMLASGQVERILKCSVRNINGGAYLYYDISSKVSLKNLYQGRKMSLEQVKDFFIQMDAIYRRLEDFFMEEKKLLMCPEYIYYDLTLQKYFGIYYPWETLEAENIYSELMDFLLNHIETGEQKLVDIIYQAYEMSDEATFSWRNLLLLFENDEEGEDVPKAETVIEHVQESETASDRIEAGGQNTYENTDEKSYNAMTYNSGISVSDDDFSTEFERNGDNDKKTYQGNRINFYHIFTFCSLCGIAGGAWVYLNYELTQQELVIVIAALSVMGLVFLFSLLQVIGSGAKNRKAEQEEEEQIRDIEDEFREERAIRIQDVLEKSKKTADVGHSFSSPSVQRQEEDEVYGETVFIDVGKQKREYKLYALDKKNKNHIEMTQFPFTIGKMAGYVDCVLADDSISRLHARIEKQGEKIILTDMNSMNGTYKNGLRMMPSESVEIEPGDEIRFGKLNYCYR